MLKFFALIHAHKQQRNSLLLALKKHKTKRHRKKRGIKFTLSG